MFFPRLLGLAVLLAAGIGSAAAQQAAVDLSKPHGDGPGCAKGRGEAATADDLLYVSKDKLVTSESSCTFVQTVPAPDGALVVMALCELQGEEGRSVSHFSISKSKTDPASIAVFDEYGASLGEVPACQP